MSARYGSITLWENYEGAVFGYNNDGEQIVDIAPLQNAATCTKWGEAYLPGRAWIVTHADGSITPGRSHDLRAAKRDARAALDAAS